MTTTFGKRGLAPSGASPLAGFEAVRSITAAERAPARSDLEKDLIARLPIVTMAAIVLLLLIFGIERRLAFDIARNGELSLESLIALGGLSYDRVIGAGEWWRLFLAPLLHASLAHVVGNCVAFFLVGLRLEPMIGRAWLAAIFVLSAFGGELGSLLGIAHSTTTVGASGAICGLIGALFVVSFQVRDPDEQRRMMMTAARFGLPALGPLVFGASGTIDYYAHSAGAVAGAIGGGFASALWSADHDLPKFRREASAAAAFALAASILATGFAASHFSSHVARASEFIPSSDLPDYLKVTSSEAAELAARYPNDPRSHIAEAIVLLRMEDLPSAEGELRRAINLARSDAALQPIARFARAVLAVVVDAEGRRTEAKAMVADLCNAGDQADADLRKLVGKSKLCD
jgi:rhomboid protease GluP